ncbi:MAG: presenilin [Candidatus Bathyarchaeota archaeon]|nr:presenilin [Candidatus Termiticorpusculum sp.]
MTSQEAKFKFSFVYLAPILVSIFFGLCCAWILNPHQTSATPVLPPATPFPDSTPSNILGTAIFYVVLIAISGTMFYFLLKQKKLKIIKIAILSVMTMAAMLLSIIYISTLLTNTIFNSIPIIVGTSILITILFDLALFKYTKAQSIAVICLGGSFGALFSFIFPLYSAIVILIAITIYDIFAVYRGPVGKIAKSGIEQLNGLSYSFKDIQMGLGDLFFYSMLSCLMYFNYTNSFIPTIMSTIGICIGSIITFAILEKKEIFPGLPFPIAIGLILGFISSLLI